MTQHNHVIIIGHLRTHSSSHNTIGQCSNDPLQYCVWVCLFRCVGAYSGVWVCLHICNAWGDLNKCIPLYIALTNFHSSLYCTFLPHTSSSFNVYCSSSLFIHLRLVIMQRTTQICRGLFVSSKRWRLTALNVLRVLVYSHHTLTHTDTHTHTHTCTGWDTRIVTCHRRNLTILIPAMQYTCTLYT